MRNLIREIPCNVTKIHMHRIPDDGSIEIQEHSLREPMGELLLQRWSPVIGNLMTFHLITAIWDEMEYLDFHCTVDPNTNLTIVRLHRPFKELSDWHLYTDTPALNVIAAEIGVEYPETVG